VRKLSLLAAVGLALSALTARANFQLSNGAYGDLGGMFSTVSGGVPGFVLNVVQTSGTTTDTWDFYALNTGMGDQAGTQNVLGVTFDFHDLNGNGLQVRTLDNADGTTRYNFDGTVVTPGNRGTYVGAGDPAKWFTVEENGDGTPGIAPGSAPDPSSFANIHVIGLANYSSNGVLADQGLGAQIGQIVFRHDDTITFDGEIGAERGPASRVFISIPEPVALPLVGGGIGLLLRRRRVIR